MLLEAHGIEKTFAGREDLRVLQGVDLAVDAGEAVAVVGPSGCGKSTLLNVLGGLLPPTAGRVVFAGEDITAFDARRLARYRNECIGTVFQQHHLLPQCTALENVLVPTLVVTDPAKRGAAAVTRAEALLEAVGLADRRHHRPARLSGGECQRVAVARALVNEPALVLADEPTGSLDEATAERVANVLLQLVAERDVALLLVTHATALAARLQRVVRLREGRLESDETAGTAPAATDR